MVIPFMAARMKQTNNFAGFRIPSRDVRSLVQIARITGQGKVASDRLAPVLFGDDMIDVKCKFVGPIRNAAIFATTACAVPNQPFEVWIH